MKKFFIIFFFSLMNIAFANQMTSPVGYWKQYDDHTGKLQSILQIYKVNNGTLSAKVITGFEIDGKAPNLYCTKCEGKNHNHRIAGMTIMTDMRAKNGYWQDGHILDPNSGRVYHCEMRLSQNGEKLSVRGYFGISLFGRTQTWVRISKEDLPALMKKAYPQPTAECIRD